MHSDSERVLVILKQRHLIEDRPESYRKPASMCACMVPCMSPNALESSSILFLPDQVYFAALERDDIHEPLADARHLSNSRSKATPRSMTFDARWLSSCSFRGTHPDW
jgi:hypothetical protein